MIPPFQPPAPEAVAHVRELANRRLSAEDFDAYVSAPMGKAERDEILSLVAWFTRRYATPAERLAWARRAYARWTASAPRR
ncbi:MAG: hypothetical protein AABZ30_06645 [Myxococcota bacterium]